MSLKKVVSLAILIGGMTLYGESSLVHAIEYEQEWVTNFGGRGWDEFFSVVETPSGGFVAVGQSEPFNYNAFIVKVDQNGSQEWEKNFGGQKEAMFNSVITTSDGGIVVVGESSSTDAGFTNQGVADAIIIKYDQDGNQQWLKSWGGNDADSFNSVMETSDGGLIVVGYSYSTNAGFTNRGGADAIIIKYDQDGNQQWLKSLGGNDTDNFKSVIETLDGGFVVVGYSYSTNAGFTNQGKNDAIIIKYDQDGNQQWMNSWGGNDGDSFKSVIETLDGGFVVVGQSASTNADFTNQGNGDAVIIKYDQDGNQQWISSWGGNGNDSFNSVIETLDGGFITVGHSGSTNVGFTNQGNGDAVIIKYDQDGNQQWISSWGGNGNDSFNSVIETSNGELVIAGYSYSSDAGFANQGNRDAILIKYSPKTDADIQINGNIQALMADVTIPSVSPDLVIDPNSPDGAMSPEFEITNDSTSPIKLELKTFEQTTNTFNDVLPDHYDSWEGLNKKESQDIALGLVAKEGDGWQRLTTLVSYVANHQAHEIGVIKPTSQVNFEFDVHHGRAFSESKTVQYKLVFVFDLLS